MTREVKQAREEPDGSKLESKSILEPQKIGEDHVEAEEEKKEILERDSVEKDLEDEDDETGSNRSGLEDEDRRLKRTEGRKRSASDIEAEQETKRRKLDDHLSEERKATLKPEVEKYVLAELYSEAAVSIALCNVNSSKEKLRIIEQKIDRIRYQNRHEGEKETLSELKEKKKELEAEIAACMEVYENQKKLKSCLEAEHKQKGEEIAAWIMEAKQDKEFLCQIESSKELEDTIAIKLQAADLKVADKERNIRHIESEIETLLHQIEQRQKELKFREGKLEELENMKEKLRKWQKVRKNRLTDEDGANQPSTSKAVNRVQERKDHNQHHEEEDGDSEDEADVSPTVNRRNGIMETLDGSDAIDDFDGTPTKNRNNRERCGTPRP